MLLRLYKVNISYTEWKMDIQDQYLDIQLCDKEFIYPVVISRYSDVISKIWLPPYLDILDTIAKYLDITIEYIK